jgi:RNA polymerase-binding protein
VPALWDCPRCGLPSGLDEDNPPARPHAEPYKSHLAYVKERRSEADADAILAEAMQRLRARRGE